jgi:hypothetical protein
MPETRCIKIAALVTAFDVMVFLLALTHSSAMIDRSRSLS